MSRSELRPEDYSCRHFTLEWTQGIVGQDNTTKGEAGERGLYYALQLLAKEEKFKPPALLGEPDDPELIARKNSYPDVYQRVDDIDILFESRNPFYYHGDWTGNSRWTPHPFFEQPLSSQAVGYTAESVIKKDWTAARYPIRGTSVQVRQPDGTRTYEYERYTGVIKETRQKVFVVSVPSFQQPAWDALVEFFGVQNIVSTQHPILQTDDPHLTGKFVQIAEDRECALTALATLKQELEDLIFRLLRDKP